MFAAFNAPRKISPAVIDRWAEILRRSSHSVLWVMIDGDLARCHFLAAFKKRGVDAESIIFAPTTSYDAHIARLQAADAALGTFVELAVALSDPPHKVAGLKRAIARNRFTAPLFDAERFCRHQEGGYEMMAGRAKAKLPPDHLDVPRLPARSEAFSTRI